MNSATTVDAGAGPAEGAIIQTTASGSLANWPAVFAGATIAIAISLLLTMFGNSIGLSMAGPFSSDGLSLQTIGIAAIVWFALTHIYAVGMGAYLAGRMRPRVQVIDRGEVQFRDGMNGLVVWALAAIATGVMITQLFASVVAGSAQLIAGGTSATGALVTNPRVSALLEDLVDDVVIGNGSGIALAQPTSGATGRSTNAPTDNPQRSSAGNSSSLSAEDRRVIVRSVGRRLSDGTLSSTDVDQLTRIIAARTGVEPSVMKQRLETAAKTTATAIEEATTAARQYAALTGFWTTFILLLSGLAAWWCGAVGGVHRDVVD
jgi:hypothetical protein